MKNILILGKGRIGKAVKYYLKKYNLPLKVSFFSEKSKVKNYDLLIGALPGEVGEMSLELALRFKKDLIDISDLEPSFYLKHKKEIEKKEIRVFPLWGFSPGLTNLICGRETKKNDVKEIEILAGTLSPKKFSFPFLWSFEDLIEGHRLKATLIKTGKKIKVSSFSDYQREKIEGIEAESYLGEGLTSLFLNLKVKNMSYRILRSFGFSCFFQYLENHGFLKEKNMNLTRKVLENKKQDNLTLAEIRIKTKDKKILWKIKSFSKKNEKLNSIQKITGIFPAILVKILSEKDFPQKGLFFPEKIGENEKLFKKILKELKKELLLTDAERIEID